MQYFHFCSSFIHRMVNTLAGFLSVPHSLSTFSPPFSSTSASRSSNTFYWTFSLSLIFLFYFQAFSPTIQLIISEFSKWFSFYLSYSVRKPFFDFLEWNISKLIVSPTCWQRGLGIQFENLPDLSGSLKVNQIWTQRRRIYPVTK